MKIDWIEVTKENPLPRQSKEFLTKNSRCNNILSLVSYCKIHNHFKIKGEYIFEGNAGTHYCLLEI